MEGRIPRNRMGERGRRINTTMVREGKKAEAEGREINMSWEREKCRQENDDETVRR